MTGQVRQFGKGDRRGRQKLRVPTISLSINVGGEGGSCWMACRDPHFTQKMSIFALVAQQGQLALNDIRW